MLALGFEANAAEERVVHRFLSVAISPDGKNVASVEGDASPSGGEPVIRTLTIRTVDGKHTVSVALPCGGVRECWPSSPVWSADGKTLAFALRKPGTHARSVYTVAADGSNPKDILDFNGTIGDIKIHAERQARHAGGRRRRRKKSAPRNPARRSPAISQVPCPNSASAFSTAAS